MAKKRLETIREDFSHTAGGRWPYAVGILECGHGCSIPLVDTHLRCECGHEGRDWNTVDGCPDCGAKRGTVVAQANPHDPAHRLLAPGDEVECDRCDWKADALQRLRELDWSTISHTRFREWCGVGIIYVYRRDGTSPSGVLLEMSVEACPEAEEILRKKRNSPLSPTEGLGR